MPTPRIECSTPRRDPTYLVLAAACMALTVVAFVRTWWGIIPTFAGPLLLVLIPATVVQLLAFFRPEAHRLVAGASAVLAFGAVALVHSSLHWAGFPDGYMTEFDVATEFLFTPFWVPSVALGLLDLFLAWRGPDPWSRRRLRLSSVVWVVLVGLALLIEWSFVLFFDHGVGG